MAATTTPTPATPAHPRNPGRRTSPHRALQVTRYALFYGCLSLIALVFIGPYLIAFFGEFQSEANLFATSPWAPRTRAHLGNFRTVLFTDHFLEYLGNTALVTCVLTAGQVTFGVLAAYAFARLEFPGRDALFYLYLATLMVPNVVTLVPLYTMMREFHLTNTYWAIFLPYVLGIPYTIFLMRQYFMSLPSDVFAAARLDGCSEWRILTRIVVPMGNPVVVTATSSHCLRLEQFPWPLIVTDSNSEQVLRSHHELSQFQRQWDLVLAASLVSLVPLLVISPCSGNTSCDPAAHRGHR